MKHTLIAVGIVALVGAVGFYLLNRTIYEEKQADMSAYSFGTYGYRCGDGTEFTMSPAEDMSTILLTPASTIERIPEVILTEEPAESGVRFAGDGITFAAVGETVTLSTDEWSTTCFPMESDGAPFNFGD